MKVKTIWEYFPSNCEQNSNYLKYIKKVVAKSIVCYTQDVILYSVMKDIGPPWWLKQ